MSHPVIAPKKLIEVALPLDAINAAAAREKSIRHGHPSTLHLWWARRPLAAARAVIFSQLVHDPEDLWRCQNPGVEPNAQVKGHWTKARARLFKIIEDLVKWENTTNEAVLEPARAEIRKAWRESCELNRDHPQANELFDPEKMPGLHDPFAGGGTIPLEAQRLGLEAHASDLNPVAVLINKAMIEIPPKFAGRPPVHPDCLHRDGDWKGAAGLAEDVRYYGKWMRDEAFRRIGHLYPPIEVTAEMAKDRPDLAPYVGDKLTVIAWLWARTVKSPNPAFSHVDVPLASTFVLSSKEGKESYVAPIIGKDGYVFTVKVGKPPDEAKGGTTFGKQKGFRCLMSQAPVSYEYIREEALAERMGQKLMAIVAEGTRGRVYLAPTSEQATLAVAAEPEWKPDLKIPEQALGFRVQLYGMRTFGDLFTPRQLVALTTFSDLVGEAREKVLADALGARASRPPKTIHSRGYLPHWEVGARPQAITFRLADSLPQSLLESWKAELDRLPAEQSAKRRRQAIEAALDQGIGACHLRRPEIARLVEDALLHFDGTRYDLQAWTIMPNHVHALIVPLHGNSLSSIVHSWKSFTAKQANARLGLSGQFWQEEYFDRMIRDEDHWYNTVAYIEENPVKAGLCARAEEWPFGSACRGGEAEEEERA
ncbi:MAG: REP-associated tyrosine transposase, partial [Isosphaeraceae bacterium]